MLSPLTMILLAVAAALAGYWARARLPLLDRLNLPPAIIGGLAGALAFLLARAAGAPPVRFDPAVQQPLMIAFFTSLGFGASLGVLRAAGRHVIVLLALAAVVGIIQGLVGAAVAVAFGLKPLTGVLAGTVTLSGGPATGLAFAPQFEAAGVPGAAALATATAMGGILLASLFGAPLATWLIMRRTGASVTPPPPAIQAADATTAASSPGAGDRVRLVLTTIVVLAFAMWTGGMVSRLIQAGGVTLPAYIGAMLVGAALRNLDDLTGWLRLPMAALDVAGTVALSLFLAMALMGLDLTLLASLAAPLVVNLAVQLLLMALLVIGPVWWLMGRDYQAAVVAGGFAGFMLGTTANAVAIMRALTDKYGPAPRAVLAVPLVGGFFIDFANALIITMFLNLMR